MRLYPRGHPEVARHQSSEPSAPWEQVAGELYPSRDLFACGAQLLEVVTRMPHNRAGEHLPHGHGAQGLMVAGDGHFLGREALKKGQRMFACLVELDQYFVEAERGSLRNGGQPFRRLHIAG